MRKFNPLEVISFVESKLKKVNNEYLAVDVNYNQQELVLESSIAKVKYYFTLPNGCSALKIKGPCYVCIFNRLDSSFYDLVDSLKSFSAKSKNNISVCIIVLEDSEEFEHVYKWRRNYIQVKKFSAWVKKYKTIGIGFQTYIDKNLFQDLIINQAKRSVEQNKVTLFVGAGLGSSMSLPDWNQLLTNLWTTKNIKIQESKIDDVVDKSPLQKARFMFPGFTESDYDELWKQLYGTIPTPSDLLHAIGDIYSHNKIDSIITYNYDDYIEQRIGFSNCKSIYKGIRAERKFPVYHVHGLIPQRKTNSKSLISGIVLTENQYHSVYNKAYSWVNVEQYHALSRKTCFFIGMSMTDPNLRRLLDAVLSESQDGEHFVFMVKIDNKFGNDNEKMFAFASLMSNLGVSVIWCDDFDDLPLKIKRVFGIK